MILFQKHAIPVIIGMIMIMMIIISSNLCDGFHSLINTDKFGTFDIPDRTFVSHCYRIRRQFNNFIELFVGLFKYWKMVSKLFSI